MQAPPDAKSGTALLPYLTQSSGSYEVVSVLNASGAVPEREPRALAAGRPPPLEHRAIRQRPLRRPFRNPSFRSAGGFHAQQGARWSWCLAGAALGVVGFVLLVAFLISLPILSRGLALQYSPALLVVEVNGCDVDIVPGGQHEVRVDTVFSSAIQTAVTEAGEVTYLSVESGQLCEQLYQMRCAAGCLVTVRVPPSGNTSLQIYQNPLDISPSVVVRVTDVVLRSLHVHDSSGFTAGPTIELQLHNVTVWADTTATLTGGSVHAEHVRLLGTTALTSSKGSVRLQDLQTEGTVAARYRAPNQQACLMAGPEQVVTPDPAGLWALCNGSALWQTTLRLYDANNDGLVDANELQAGVAALGGVCCGALCPFTSQCASLNWILFPTNGASLGRSNVLPAIDFRRSLQALNYTALVPGCLREVVFAPEEGSGPPAGAARLTLVASAADVVLTVAQPLVMAPPDDAADHFGLQLTLKDAAVLQALGPKYGVMASTDDVLLTIDVAASPGVPPGRWVYATHPAFLAVQPGYVFMLSVGLLVPALVHVRVDFGAAECSAAGLGAIPEGRGLDYPARLAALHGQLVQALRGSGLDTTSPIRGEALFLAPNGTLFRVYEDAPTGRAVVRAAANFTPGLVVAALALDLTLGLLVGALAVVWFYRRATFESKMNLQRELVQRKVFESRYGRSPALMCPLASIDPFGDPVEALNELLIWPLLQTERDSVAMFIAEHCVIHDMFQPQEQAPRTPAAEVYEAYEAFCLKQQMGAKSADALQGTLTQQQGVRTLALTGEQLLGVRWRLPAPQQSSPPATGDGAAVVKAILAQYCVATGEATDFIELRVPGTCKPSNPVAPKPPARTGRVQDFSVDLTATQQPTTFLAVLQVYCVLHDLPIPSDVQGALKEAGLPPMEYSEIFFCNLELLPTDARPRSRALRWYGLQAAALAIHVILLLLPTALLLAYAMQGQQLFAQTMAAQPALQWVHLWTGTAGKLRMPLLDVVFIWTCVVSGLVLLRMLMSYTGLTVSVYRRPFGVVWGLHCYVLAVVVAGVAAWVVLAGLLYPNRYLPQATAVVVAVTLMVTRYNALRKEAEKLQTATSIGLAGLFRQASQSSWDYLSQQATAAAQARAAGDKPSSSAPKVVPMPAPIASGTDEPAAVENALDAFTPQQLFAAIDANHDGLITVDEMQAFLEQTAFPLTRMQQEWLFAYCDADGSGTVAEVEFQEGWEGCKRWIVAQTAAAAGLSHAQIIFFCFVLAVVFILFCTFIFVAAQVWLNTTYFDAVLQSLVLVAIGKATSLLPAGGAARRGVTPPTR